MLTARPCLPFALNDQALSTDGLNTLNVISLAGSHLGIDRRVAH